MMHLTDEQIARMAFGPIDPAEEKEFAERLDACAECKGRYVKALLPTVEREEALAADRRERLYERILENCPGTRSNVLPFRRGVYRAAAGFAAAAGILLGLLFIYGRTDNSDFPRLAASGSPTVNGRLPLFSVRDVSGSVTINGETCDKPRRLPAPPLTVEVGAGAGTRLELAATASIEVRHNTAVSFDVRGADTVTANLAFGEINASWDRTGGRELFVTVPGGMYHVVGTIFRIGVDSLGSTLAVTRGAVAFIPDHPHLRGDTVRAGESRRYSALGETLKSSVLLREATASGSGGASVGESVSSPPSAASGNTSSGAMLSSDDFFGEGEGGTVGQVEYTALQQARVEMQLGRPKEAAALLRPMVEMPKPPAESYLALGQAFEMLGEADSAVRCYETAAGMRMPEAVRARAWLRLGALAERDGQLDKSILAYQSYLDAAPGGARRNHAFEKLYGLYERRGDIDRRTAVLEKWVEEAPELDYPVYLLAAALHTRGDYRYALRYYETYILKYPEGSEREAAMYYAADCSRRLGEQDAYAAKARRYRESFPQGRFVELVTAD